MIEQVLTGEQPVTSHLAQEVASKCDQRRLRALVLDHFDAVWRFLRRIGLCPADVDDAVQEAMIVAAEKLREIEPGRERAFLISSAFHMAMRIRRKQGRRREDGEDGLWEQTDAKPSPEDLSNRLRARAILDSILDHLPLEQRAVFVLAEFEEMSTAQIAELLSVPHGTVASRLRRAREVFDIQLARAHAQQRSGGGAA